MADPASPVRAPLRERLRELSGPPMHVAVWLLAAGAAIAIFAGRSRGTEYLGLAQAVQYEVSATTAGTVASVLPDVYEPVEAGQVLAHLDDAEIAARLETERAVLEQLTGELEAELLRLGFQEAGLIEDRRRFQIDEQQLQLEILSTRVVLEGDQIELERLNLQVGRIGPLAGEGIVAPSEYDDLRLTRDRIARRIEENRNLLLRVESEHHAARSRREAYEKQFPDVQDKDPVLRPLRDAVRAQERRLDEIEIQRRGLVLRSPVAGRVTQVLARSGQAILPGEPLVLVVEHAASEIIAFAPEPFAGRIAERARATATRRQAPFSTAESIVARVGPGIEVLPQRLWRDPVVPEYGRPFVVAAVPGLKLTPGEVVTVRLIER